jgi:hypothetical protein
VCLVVAKDRVGGVGVAGQIVAELHFSPSGGNTHVEWKEPGAGAFRPTVLMEKVLNYLRVNPSATLSALRGLGNSGYVDRAIDCLVEDGAIRVTRNGPGRATKYEVLNDEG